MIRKIERESDESIKKYWNDIWLNPKCYKEWTTSSQVSNNSKLMLEKGSTTIPEGSRLNIIEKECMEEIR